MNILFITDTDISPFDGGIERVTQNLAIEFKKRNINCYLAYVAEIHTPSSQDFKDKIQLKGDDWPNLLLNYLKINQINCVMTNVMKKNNIRSLLPPVYNITRNTNCKLFFCYHCMPGYEVYGNRFVIRVLRKLGLSFIILKIISRKLRYGLYSDKIILLSKEYIPVYQKIIGKQINEKFGFVPNALSFNEIADESILPTKEKVVLIVSRFDECQKRLSLSLKIWQQIEKTNQFNDWTLKIVGGGEEEKNLLQLAQQLQLKNISFEGKQNPIEYYRKAALFMMTSAYEGFPMTIGEAQQNGCVSIAFNSFAAITDLIAHKQNGMIVNNNHIEEYAEALKELMQNREERERLAQNGLKSCERYTRDKVVDRWMNLLNSCVS